MTAVTVILVLLLLVALIFMRMIMPNMGRDLSSFKGKNFAHRGLHSGDNKVPENSLAAFRLAREQGYGVELDVQLTADKKVVVFHDMNLKRMCGVDKRVKELTFEELERLRLLDSEEKIPLFIEVLKVLIDVPVICELKTTGTNTEVCQYAYDIFKTYKGNLCVEAFSPFAVRWFKKNQPETIRGQLSMDFLRDRNGLSAITAFCLKHLLTNFWTKPDFIAYCHEDVKVFGFRACKKLYNPLCIAWTIRSTEELKKANANFQSIIFEKMGQHVKK